jgi:hypothetical protein
LRALKKNGIDATAGTAEPNSTTGDRAAHSMQSLSGFQVADLPRSEIAEFGIPKLGTQFIRENLNTREN